MNLYFGFSKVKKERLTNKIYNKPSITVSPCWHVKVCLSIGKVRGGVKEAANPPVSELESPKLKIAGNSQFSKSKMVAEVAKGMEKERRVIR